MEKKYQVFISSTYEDLQAERRKVQDTILSMYQFPIGMEMFSAADEEQWEIIKETIDSSDYYILIIGYRYGSVIEEGECAGMSYTQREFQYALEKKIPILAFLIDDGVSITLDKVEQDADKKQKLEKFKNKVKEGRTVQWWTSVDDLETKVMNALNKQIIRRQRPGWIRADAVNFEETQNELVEMSKKIRKLEKKNEELRKRIVERKPILTLMINDDESIVKVPYIEYDTTLINEKYMPLSVKDIPNEARSSITQNMIDEYNGALPIEKELKRFKNDWRFYEQAQKNPFNINIKICNMGNLKAKDIYIEIQFPDEIAVYRNSAQVSAPMWPKKGKNPIEEYYEKNNLHQNNDMKINPAFAKTRGGVDTALFESVKSKDNCFYNDDNSLSIRMEDLMTGYAWNINKKYFLVPKKRGRFEIICNFMCEEYEEDVEQIVEVVVE